MARVGAMLKGAELLLSGVTCVNDTFCHTSQGSLASLGAVDGLEAMGLRGLVAFGVEDAADPQPVAAVLAEHQALADRCAASARVGFRLGVGTVLGQSDELLAASAAEASATAGPFIPARPTEPPPTTARTCSRRSRRPPCSRRWPGSTRPP
jgi:5-methylthioadenosine/S-adenosylhomocysteine deaminase